ncbi:MAG TPA: hypothetical protein DGT23_12440 [Micromonosporaceae bacterium]|nr:hypothetical protein [Micromonosporaceae bacterium]
MKFEFTGLSPNTRRAYAAAWHKFSEWCTKHSRMPLPATEQTLVNYVAFLSADTNCSPSTARVSLAALRWMHRRGARVLWEGGDRLEMALKALEQHRADSGHRPKPARVFSAKQAELLLEEADADGYRSSALIALMLYTGVRIGELLSLQVSDISQEKGVPVLRIAGRGRKRRSLPVIPAVYVRLERYLSSYPHGGPLFVIRPPSLPNL